MDCGHLARIINGRIIRLPIILTNPGTHTMIRRMFKNPFRSNKRVLFAAALVIVVCLFFFATTSAQSASSDFTTTHGLSAVATDGKSYVSAPSNRDTGLALDIAATSATPTTATLAFDESRMMRAADLRPGMKGYGLTVFSGLKPEKFEAEVVGVRHRVFPDDDMILCQLKHPVLNDIGVVAGMSGSPVFVNDKLIGAVAYGWQFQKDALAGITPIESMLKVYNATQPGMTEDNPELADTSSFNAYNCYMEMRHSLTFRPIHDGRTGAKSIPLHADDLPNSLRDRLRLPDSFSMEPLATPLFISSATPMTLKLLSDLFAQLGVQPVVMGMAAGSGGGASADAQNSPGGPVTDLNALADELSGGYGLAIPLVEGDMSMAGVGTVSFRQGNKLVAFGHPMFEFGRVAYPMAPARINTVVRNAIRPFKLGESVGQVGVVRQDRMPAIGGVLGEKARMFDVQVMVDDPGYRGARRFNYRIWEDREMGPSLSMSVIMESIASAARSGGDTAALYEYSLLFDDGTSITKQDYIASQLGAMETAIGAGADLGSLMNNPYKRLHAQQVEFKIRINQRFPQALITSAMLDKPRYRPGDAGTITWEIQPFRKPLTRASYTFRLPDNIQEGDYDVCVSDGQARADIDMMRNPGGEKVFDFPSLLAQIRRNYPRNKTYITMRDSDTGLSVRGEQLPKLPASIIDTIQGTAEKTYVAPMTGNFIADADIITEYEISGSQRLILRISKKN